MTKSAYAKHRHVTPQMVSKYINHGRVVVNADGLVDVEVSDVLLDSYSEKMVQDTGADSRSELLDQLTSPGVSYAEQRALLTKYKAELARIDLDTRQNQLVDADAIYQAAFRISRKLRDGLQNFADRLSGPLASETDQFKVSNMLREEISHLLKEFVDELESLLGKPLDTSPPQPMDGG